MKMVIKKNNSKKVTQSRITPYISLNKKVSLCQALSILIFSYLTYESNKKKKTLINIHLQTSMFSYNCVRFVVPLKIFRNIWTFLEIIHHCFIPRTCMVGQEFLKKFFFIIIFIYWLLIKINQFIYFLMQSIIKMIL